MNNPHAFPAPAGVSHITDQGMTLRDYFAAKAMEAVIINSDRHSTSIDEVDQWVGNYAYTVADAMLRARDKT
jgi:hypothetical protein